MSVNRISLAAAGALLCLAVAALGFTSAESEKMKTAKAFFEANKFDEALSVYEEVLRSNPGSAVAAFNVGLMLYHKKDFIKAIENFQTALATEDRVLEKNALGFIGNSYFNLAEEAERIDETLAARSFREALDYYKRAMELDNEDRILRYNHELAKKRIYYIAEGSGRSGKDMMRMSVGALMQEDKEFALARKRDFEWRQEDDKTARARRDEDRRRREARREEVRAADRKRRMEDEGKGVRPPDGGQTHFVDIAARETARRAEDASREKAWERDDDEFEARRLREDAERGEKRSAERSAGQAQPVARTDVGWFERLLGCGTAWAEDAPAEEVAPPAPDVPDTPAEMTAIYEKRRSEDLERESKRRAEDNDIDRKRRIEDADEGSSRRLEDAELAPEERGSPEIVTKREKEDLEKELARVKEDRIIYIRRKKEDIELMMERSKADAEVEKARKEALERKALASDGRDGSELKEMAQSAGQAAASLEEAAARGQQMMSQIETTEAARSAEDAAGGAGGAAAGGAAAGGAGGGAGQTSGGLQEMINQEKSRLSQDMSVIGSQELGSEITGQLAPGGGSGSGSPPKANRSALEELEDALKKRYEDSKGKDEEKQEEPDTSENIRDKDAELLLETYWMGEAPKKIIEREKSPDYRKDAKDW